MFCWIYHLFHPKSEFVWENKYFVHHYKDCDSSLDRQLWKKLLTLLSISLYIYHSYIILFSVVNFTILSINMKRLFYIMYRSITTISIEQISSRNAMLLLKSISKLTAKWSCWKLGHETATYYICILNEQKCWLRDGLPSTDLGVMGISKCYRMWIRHVTWFVIDEITQSKVWPVNQCSLKWE